MYSGYLLRASSILLKYAHALRLSLGRKAMTLGLTSCSLLRTMPATFLAAASTLRHCPSEHTHTTLLVHADLRRVGVTSWEKCFCKGDKHFFAMIIVDMKTRGRRQDPDSSNRVLGPTNLASIAFSSIHHGATKPCKRASVPPSVTPQSALDMTLCRSTHDGETR